MRKGQATRERIIARAAELFNTRGYSGTAIADIMQAVELEKGGIYRHFASKDELTLAAFEHAAAIVRGRMHAASADRGHAAERLIAFVDVFRGYAQSPPLAGGCPILNAAIESDDAIPALRDRALAVVQEWRLLLRSTAHAGIARGELCPDTEPDQLADVIIATLEGAVMLSRLTDEAAPLLGAADHLRAHIERLRTKGAA